MADNLSISIKILGTLHSEKPVYINLFIVKELKYEV